MSWPPPPVTDEQREHLVRVGARVRELRGRARLSQRELGVLATLSATHVGRIERGVHRVRRSTLDRLLAHLVPADDREAVLDELAELAGPALAPESDYEPRRARRRAMRERRDRDQQVRILRESAALVAKLGRQLGDDEQLELAAQMRAEAAELAGAPLEHEGVLSMRERAIAELDALQRQPLKRRMSMRAWQERFDREAELKRIIAEGDDG